MERKYLKELPTASNRSAGRIQLIVWEIGGRMVKIATLRVTTDIIMLLNEIYIYLL